uniref:Uncharacterized protein n=1 Tax=Toxoplasma gondii (strain ATCC 50861 / VEG) TaxID=432359 RepID=A0A0F7VCW9_TOXGV|nr:TPA: hypothetical protein BN1205_101760 [Toxoplasma gondii VEG]
MLFSRPLSQIQAGTVFRKPDKEMLANSASLHGCQSLNRFFGGLQAWKSGRGEKRRRNADESSVWQRGGFSRQRAEWDTVLSTAFAAISRTGARLHAQGHLTLRRLFAVTLHLPLHAQ